MRLGIMQPYFFPYLGYLALIKHTDKWIVFDTPQFIRHGWIERNRILKPNEGWQYIKVPLQKHSRSTSIKDIRINNSTDWKTKISAQIYHYKKRSPYFSQVNDLINNIFDSEFDSIVELNTQVLVAICSYLEIPFNYEIFSEMNLELGEINAPDEWALRISGNLGADEYINPPGGREFFDPDKYKRSNIKLSFLEIALVEYSQRRSSFENGLSIIDVMMFNSPDEINAMLNNVEIS